MMERGYLFLGQGVLPCPHATCNGVGNVHDERVSRREQKEKEEREEKLAGRREMMVAQLRAN
jgi:hypothetical protein